MLHGEVLTGFKHSLKKQPPKFFCKKGVLKKLVILTEKCLCWSLFLINLQALKQHFYKETPTQVFSCEYCEIFKNLCFKGHL